MDITVRNLSKRFDKDRILKDINLVFPSGSRIALVGANGSGKSTLLRTLMGMISYEGEIVFSENDRPLSFSALPVKQQIAYVPQISPYFSSLVSDVVETVLRLRGRHLDSFREYLERMHLSYQNIAHLPFRKLSGGMKQKLLIALAFTAMPQVLLLDEPTASLDPDSREGFYRLCKEFSKISLLLCSHRLEEIHNLVDEVVVLDKGVIVFKGATQDYLNKVLK